jgi:hypothetical protein
MDVRRPYLVRRRLDRRRTGRYSPLEYMNPEATPVQSAIAANVAGLIEDGATLQFGLGSLTDALRFSHQSDGCDSCDCRSSIQRDGVRRGVLPAWVVLDQDRNVVSRTPCDYLSCHS